VRESLGEVGFEYMVTARNGTYWMFAAGIDPELQKAFKAAQRSRRREVRRLKAKSTPQEHDVTERRMARGGEKVVILTFFPYERFSVIEAMRLTLNEHHRKLRVSITYVPKFCHPLRAGEWLHRCSRPGR
jgi:hypothetical protein